MSMRLHILRAFLRLLYYVYYVLLHPLHCKGLLSQFFAGKRPVSVTVPEFNLHSTMYFCFMNSRRVTKHN